MAALLWPFLVDMRTIHKSPFLASMSIIAISPTMRGSHPTVSTVSPQEFTKMTPVISGTQTVWVEFTKEVNV